MIFGTAKRLLTLTVLAFAAMGFLAVPLGEKSGFEHTRDFFTSDEAQAASDHLGETFDTLESEWKKAQETQDETEGGVPSHSPSRKVIRRR